MKNNIFTYFTLLAIVLTVTGCSDRNFDGDPSELDSPPVYVKADIKHNSQSRTYQAEGEIVDGTYNLTYPTTATDVYNVGEVRFGISAENPQIGYVTLPGDLPLKWLSVGGGSTPTLYLDNIPRNLDGATTSTTVTFAAGSNPYIAAPFDSIGGSNDMLWGAEMFQRNAGTLHFNLQHAMARVRLIITVDNSNGDIDLTGATVKITNLNQTPLSFNRLDGTFGLNTDDMSAYSELVFIAPGDDNRSWIHQYSLPDDKNVYQSPDFILPPQDILQDDNRPQLIITLANGVQYSGILPSAMLIGDGVHDEPSYPVAFSFLSQYVLTIRTVVTDEPPTLTFMPVYVMKWVDKGSFDEEAHQSGIYTEQEFYKMIEYYNNGNTFQLDRYGKQKEVNDNKVWHFDFWHGVTLDYNRINGKMKVNDKAGPFTFSFNNFTISVKYNDTEEGVKAVSSTELYSILTGN